MARGQRTVFLPSDRGYDLTIAPGSCACGGAVAGRALRRPFYGLDVLGKEYETQPDNQLVGSCAASNGILTLKARPRVDSFAPPFFQLRCLIPLASIIMRKIRRGIRSSASKNGLSRHVCHKLSQTEIDG